MDYKNMQSRNFIKIVALAVFVSAALFAFACNNRVANTPNSAPKNTNSAASTPNPDSKPPTMTDYPVGNAQTPSEAYRMLFAAVKSQDPAKIKSMLSKGSLGLAEMASGQQKKTIDEVVKNGFTETTFADTMPQMRDERIKGGYAAVEVWNTTRKQWDDIPLILEGGTWKAAFGDAFGGKWVSPGKGQAVIEQEEANAKNPNLVPQGNANANVSRQKNVPKAK
jgi:hypothetical protein